MTVCDIPVQGDRFGFRFNPSLIPGRNPVENTDRTTNAVIVDREPDGAAPALSALFNDIEIGNLRFPVHRHTLRLRKGAIHTPRRAVLKSGM